MVHRASVNYIPLIIHFSSARRTIALINAESITAAGAEPNYMPGFVYAWLDQGVYFICVDFPELHVCQQACRAYKRNAMKRQS